MVLGGWTFVAVVTVRSDWTPTVIGWVTVALGSVVGGFIASRQSPLQRLNEPVVAAALVAATLIGIARFTETGAHHGGYPLVGVALVAALVGAFVAHRLPGRGGPATRLRGAAISTLICCGCWVVMFFALEAWDDAIGNVEGLPLAAAIIVTIFGCGAMARFAMPETSRRVVASGGFFCPMLFLIIGLVVNRGDPPDAEFTGVFFGITGFATVSYGCAWVGSWLASWYLAKQPEPPPLPPAAVRDAGAARRLQK